jgi:electron transport complex protein RnfD
METVTENPSYKLELTSSPHIHSRWSTQYAMWLVVGALIPSVVSAVLFFGWYQLVIIGFSIGTALGTEALIKYIRKRKITISDGSGVITGLLLALILPPNFSLFGTVIGAVIAIGIGKEVFGGLGYNIFNPALAGRAFLQASFPVAMTTWTIPNFALVATTTATPLASMKFDQIHTSLSPLFWGNIGGSIGETSALAVIIGGVFLIAIGVVNWRIPVSMILGMIIFGGILWFVDPVKNPDPFFHIFAGGFLFGMFFMATDWVTSPITAKGMWIFGMGISLLVVLIRVYGGLPEGVMFSILFMNGFVPLINRFTQPKTFGAVK